MRFRYVGSEGQRARAAKVGCLWCCYCTNWHLGMYRRRNGKRVCDFCVWALEFLGWLRCPEIRADYLARRPDVRAWAGAT